jgi:hypothetical protein
MKLTFLTRVTEEEYRANLTGMNTFFGAVLGFVLADAKTESLIGFGHLLSSAGRGHQHPVRFGEQPSLAVRRHDHADDPGLPRLLDDGPVVSVGSRSPLRWRLLTVSIEPLGWQQKRDAKATSPCLGPPATLSGRSLPNTR